MRRLCWYSADSAVGTREDKVELAALEHCLNQIDASATTTSMPSSKSSLVSMKTIRQRKADASPSSRGTTYPQEEMVRIVIEQKGDRHNDPVERDDLDLHSYHYTPPQPLGMIPDRRYTEFIQGQTSKLALVSACPGGPECACHCITFSWIAVAFLVSCSCSRL